MKAIAEQHSRMVAAKAVGAIVAGLLALLMSVVPAGAAKVRPADGAFPSPTADIVAPTIPASTSFNAAQNWLQGALSDRSQELSNLTSLVSSAKLIAADRTALSSLLSSTTSGISALTTKVGNDATVAQIRTDAASMVLNFRVYSLVRPLVATVVQIDTVTLAINNIVSLEPGINAAIAANQQAHQSEKQATQLAQDIVARVSDADSALSGLAASLEALTPQSYPSSLDTITSARASIAQARGDVNGSTNDISQIVGLLANPALDSQVKAHRFRRVSFT